MTHAPTAGSWRVLHWLLVVLIAHGSIYPWHFVAPASVPDAFAALLAQRRWWSNTSDVLENIALFVPLGAVWAWSRGSAPVRPGAWLAMALGSVLFATALQVVQLWLPQRVPQLSDVLWNAVGQALGVALGLALRAPLGALAATRGLPPAALALILLWLGLEFFPFAPTIDWQQVKDALKPLLLNPQWHWRSTADAALGLVVLAQLLRDVRGRAWWIAVLIGLALLSKPLVIGLSYSAGHVAGWALGALLAPLVWRVPPHRAVGVTVLALAWFTVDALRPYTLAEQPNRFHWMPFEAALLGSTLTNALALGHDLFWLGAVMVLAGREGARPGPTAFALGTWALMLEGVQTLLPGRVPDVTSALVPFVCWAFLHAVAPAPPALPAGTPRRRRRAARA